MFKLTIAFETLATLTAFVNKMGDDVIGGTITHDQAIAADKVEAAPAAAPKKKGTKAKAVEAEAVVTPSATVQQFPGGSTSFAPGNTVAQPAPQPMAQPTIAQPQPQPVVATMAPPQAPAPIAQPVQVDPVRQRWNDACISLIKTLETNGPGKGYDQARMGGILTTAFTEAGCAGKGISSLSDAQIQTLYPVLHKHISAALA